MGLRVAKLDPWEYRHLSSALVRPRTRIDYDTATLNAWRCSFAAMHYSQAKFGSSARKMLEKRTHRRIKLQGLSHGKNLPVPCIHFDQLSDPEKLHLRSVLPGLRHPVVIRGLGNDLPPAREWSHEFFKERFGSEQVTIKTDVSRREEISNPPTKVVELSELVDMTLANRNDAYGINLSNIFNRNQSLRDDLDLSRIARELFGRNSDTFYVTQLFMGGGETKTWFHCTATQNLFYNVVGKKTWTFVSPEDSMAMYPKIRENGLFFHSPVASTDSPEELDRLGYPIFKYVNRYQVTLEPGDFLMSPEYWWHEVQNHGPTIAVANRFNGLLKGVSKKEVYTKNIPRLLAVNPLFFPIFALSKATREASKEIKRTGWGSDENILKNILLAKKN